MEAHFRNYATRFHQFGPGHEPLGDALVGRVIPRAPGARPHLDLVADSRLLSQFFEPSSVGSPTIDCAQVNNPTARPSLRSVSKKKETIVNQRTSPPNLRPAQRRKMTLDDKIIRRREQCKTNQARYRWRQQTRQLQLELSVQQLREEVERLERGLESTQTGRTTKYSPWTIIAEVSRILDESISSWNMLTEADMTSCAASHEEYFLPDVTMGDTCGVGSLMKQAWRWSRQCGDPELELKRVESITPGVMTATAELSVTVTEGTVDSFFPGLQRKSPSMSKRLLGQRLQLNCSMTFLLDEETGRVAHLEHNVDFVAPLLHVLGSLEDVSSALDDHRPCSK